MKKGQRRYASWKDEGFPGWLQARMNEKGWNTVQAGKAIGVVPSLVTRWLQGEQHPRRDSLRGIAEAFQISMEEVLIASGHLTPEEITSDVRMLELVRKLEAIELTDERYETIKAMLGSYQTPTALSDHQDDRPPPQARGETTTPSPAPPHQRRPQTLLEVVN